MPSESSSDSKVTNSSSLSAWWARCGRPFLGSAARNERKIDASVTPPANRTSNPVGPSHSKSSASRSATKTASHRSLRALFKSKQSQEKCESPSLPSAMVTVANPLPDSVSQYDIDRAKLVEADIEHSWDHDARCFPLKGKEGENEQEEKEKHYEIKAAQIVHRIREFERRSTNGPFGDNASETLPDPETRDMGGPFLLNKDRIDSRSKLFDIARKLPKGALLHLHLNSQVEAEKLINRVTEEGLETLHIATTRQLLGDGDFHDCEVQVVVRSKQDYDVDIFSEEYIPFSGTTVKEDMMWMSWGLFTEKFRQTEYAKRNEKTAEEWVLSKIVLDKEDVYDVRKSLNWIWAKFNQGTRAFKGFFNYKQALEWYVGECIESMIEDNIMYAELRPTYDAKIPDGKDPKTELLFAQQLNIIYDCVQKKKRELELKNEADKFPFDLKVIYCLPRSFGHQMMKDSLDRFQKILMDWKREGKPGKSKLQMICGFDLVGAEDRENSIKYYVDLLLGFQGFCEKENLKIPFMFHAGETLLDTGGSSSGEPEESNLYESVLLGSKRIGHGFSLLRHSPAFIRRFKEANICIELCPISNELLHLCRSAKEHPFPQILQAGISCTLNSDNPSLFSDSNSLSHEFYQVMVGWPRMNLHGWKQLARWSIDYSCLDEVEERHTSKLTGESLSDRQYARELFHAQWKEFCKWVVDNYEGKEHMLKTLSAGEESAQPGHSIKLPCYLDAEKYPTKPRNLAQAKLWAV